MNGALHKHPVKHPLLKKYIKFFWEIQADFMRLDHQIIPVRNIDLKFNLSDTPHYRQINNRLQLLEKAYFSVLQDHFPDARILLTGKVHVLGICFFPEGFYPFLKIPVSECKNQLLGAGETGVISTKIITEFVQFEMLETTTNEQLVDAVNRINQFQKKMDGFLDAEIARNMKDDSWSIIFHYEDMEKVQAIGAPLRSSREFNEFISLIEPESLQISFCQQFKTW